MNKIVLQKNVDLELTVNVDLAPDEGYNTPNVQVLKNCSNLPSEIRLSVPKKHLG